MKTLTEMDNRLQAALLELVTLEQKFFDTTCQHEQQQLAQKIVQCENLIIELELKLK